MTKRPERVVAMNRQIAWPENVQMGVTVESVRRLNRIVLLGQTDAKHKFISLESQQRYCSIERRTPDSYILQVTQSQDLTKAPSHRHTVITSGCTFVFVKISLNRLPPLTRPHRIRYF